MVKSDYVFDSGEPIDVGAAGEHDYVYESGEQVTDSGVSELVFETGTGLRGLSGGGGEGPWDYFVITSGGGGANAALYDVAADSWETRTSMPFPSDYTDGAALNNKVWCVGGNGTSSGGERTAVYDPSADSWTQLADLPFDKDFPAGASAQGAVYSIGGDNLSQEGTQSISSEGSGWSNLSTPPRQWEGHAAAELDGLIYITSGDRNDTRYQAFEYDPAADSYTRIADTPNNFEVHALTSRGGFLWSFGGSDDAQEVRRYDPNTDSWSTSFTRMPFGLQRGNAINCTDGTMHVFGGTQSPTAHHAYDPNTDSWTQKASLPFGYNRGVAAGTNVK